MQPEDKLEPALLAGHATAGCEMLGKKDKLAQVETKNGDTEEAVTVPESPGLHVQPIGTLGPTLLAGHSTAGMSSRSDASNERLGESSATKKKKTANQSRSLRRTGLRWLQ